MNTQITWFDYLVLSLVLSISVLIGFYHGFKDKLRQLLKTNRGEQTTSAIELDPIEADREVANRGKTSEYLMANSSMGTFPVAMSLLATVYSATSLLGVPAEVYQYGIQFWISAFAQSLCPLIGAFITGPFFASHNVHSIFEYFELRFNSKYVRTVASICYVIKNSITCSIFMYGPATSLALLANLNEKTCIALLGFIGTLYTAIGGIRGVIWNDLFQGLVMFISLLIIILKGVYDAGGLWNLFETNSRGGRLNLFNFNPDPFIRQSFWSITIGQLFYMCRPYCFDQQMIQRFQASRTKKIAVRALILNCPGVFLLVTLCCSVGLILYAVFAGCDPLITKQISTPNQLVGLFVVNSFKDYPGIAGLFLASLFCGSLSSVSSFLNSQAAIIWHDLLKPFKFFSSLNDVKSLTTNKILVLISGLVATCLAFIVSTLGGNISQINYSLNGAFASPILGLFLLGMFFSVTTPKGATIGIIVGFFAALWISMGAYITKPKYPMLNVTTEFCPNSTDFNFSPLIIGSNRTVVMASDLTGVDKFYSLSYMWFNPFGVLVTISVGLVSSLVDTYFFSRANHKPQHNKNMYIYYDLCCVSC